jgi:hypothetical protein
MDPDPDPEGPKTDGSGSATLAKTIYVLYCGALLSYPPLCPAGLRLLQVFGSLDISLLHRHIQIKALHRTKKVTVAI